MDIGNQSGFCDYFVICSAESPRQVDAIHQETVKLCRRDKIAVRSHQDDESLRWILVDLFDVVLHIFLQEAREFYGLEHLWNTAKRVRLPSSLKVK